MDGACISWERKIIMRKGTHLIWSENGKEERPGLLFCEWGIFYYSKFIVNSIVCVIKTIRVIIVIKEIRTPENGI